MSLLDGIDETTLRPEWRDRPRVGDIVESRDPYVARMTGRYVVTDTYYRNGEGGMHIIRDGAACVQWASCHEMRIVERAKTGS